MEDRTYILLVAAILTLAYIVPVITQQQPSGSDVFSHMVYTEIMQDSRSMTEFYENCFEKRYLGYEYPFGMWLFGAEFANITGLDILTVSYLLPLLMVFTISLSFYLFAANYLKNVKLRLLSIIFLLSMPIISTSILQYQTVIFVTPVLIFIFYLISCRSLSYLRYLILLAPAVFIICISHTGTYMFLVFFALVYMIIYGIVCGEFNNRIYSLVAASLIAYSLSVTMFPHIHQQYIDKGTMLLSMGTFLSSKLHIPFAYDLCKLFYDNIFVEKSIIKAMLWSGFIYGTADTFIVLTRRPLQAIKNGVQDVKNRLKNNFLAIPIIGDITKISHSLASAPIWIGPIHSLLTIASLPRLSAELFALLLSASLVTILPGYQTSAYAATGALREIYYLLLVIPICSAVGFLSIESKIKSGKMKMLRAAYPFLIFIVFAGLVISPVIGNVYYQPAVGGTQPEMSSLVWLKSIGNPDEGVDGAGYRERVMIYSDKEAPSETSVPQGSETRAFYKNRDMIYLTNQSEKNLLDMYSLYNINYYISSSRVANNMGSSLDRVMIGNSRVLDSIYSNSELEIYRYIKPPKQIVYENDSTTVSFNETAPLIKDLGTSFLVETTGYRIILGKDSPRMGYFGDKNRNYLGDGYFSDFLKISWYSAEYNNRIGNYLLPETNYSTSIQGNRITYATTLQEKTGGESWASMQMIFTFYENAVKNELIIANDWVETPQTMGIDLSTKSFTPTSYMTYTDWYGYKNEKRVYPSDDSSKIKGKTFYGLFLNNGDEGIYLRYEDTAPYPADIIFQGSTNYNYSIVEIDYQRNIGPGDRLHVTRYLGVGDESFVESSVEKYISVKAYPYQDGSLPLIITSNWPKRAIGEEEADTILNTYEKMEREGLIQHYTEGISPQDSKAAKMLLDTLLMYNAPIMSYSNISENVNGRVAEDFRLDLGTIRELSSSTSAFLEASNVGVPVAEYNQEGLRYPRYAYYHGNVTSVLIFPVSSPDSSDLKSEGSSAEAANSWKAIINAAIRNDDPAVFHWRSNEIGRNEGYMNITSEVASYAKKMGMTPDDPNNVARHMALMRNVSLGVTKNLDSAMVILSNENTEQVTGATFKIILPKVEEQCPYTILNGIIKRNRTQGQNCILYASADLKPKEVKKVYVNLIIPRREFSIAFAKTPKEGINTISVGDENGKPMQDVQVWINKDSYKTDMDGRVKADLIRGVYRLRIERPGYTTIEFDYQVKGRVYTLKDFLKDFLP